MRKNQNQSRPVVQMKQVDVVLILLNLKKCFLKITVTVMRVLIGQVKKKVEQLKATKTT